MTRAHRTKEYEKPKRGIRGQCRGAYNAVPSRLRVGTTTRTGEEWCKRSEEKILASRLGGGDGEQYDTQNKGSRTVMAL